MIKYQYTLSIAQDLQLHLLELKSLGGRRDYNRPVYLQLHLLELKSAKNLRAEGVVIHAFNCTYWN